MYLDLISHYHPLEVEVSGETGEQGLPGFFVTSLLVQLLVSAFSKHIRKWVLLFDVQG